MSYKFIDDGEPEADDYASNYVWVEPPEPRSQRQKKACCLASKTSVAARWISKRKKQFWPFG